MTTTELLAPADCPPTTFYVPEGARFTLADEVADLMVSIGYDVAEPERDALHALAPQQANGDWIGLESGIVAPRQNLKTACMIGLALHDLFVQQVERVVWTAHEFKTSTDAFKDIRAIVEGTDWLTAEVKRIRISNGKEGIDLTSGGRLDVIARTGKSGRGMTAPRLYMDEAMYTEPSMMGALVPVMSARPNAHIVYGSSPGVPASVVLRGLRKRGRSGVDPNLGWIEWSQEQGECEQGVECGHEPGTPGCWLDDLAAVMRVNPAAGRRITLDFLEQERRTLAAVPAEYLRERMGVWEDGAGDESADPPYPVDRFESLVDDSARPASDAPIAWAIDVSWDRRSAWIAKAARGTDDVPLARVAFMPMSPHEVVEFAAAEIRKSPALGVAVQATAGSPSSSIIDALRKALDGHCEVVEMTGADCTVACGVVFDAISGGSVRRATDPLLSAANRRGVKRILSGAAWAIDRKASPIDVANLVAWTDALWLLLTQPEQGEPGVWFL